MSKKEINKEIVALRKLSHQTITYVIKKLTRDIKKYREKKGTEEQKAKNVRKADRLLAEVMAIKKEKPDNVTKFALKNTSKLLDVLNSRDSDPLTRALIRAAFHKKLSAKIEEMKKKYPNCQEFLGPGRKKKAVLEWKERKKQKKEMNREANDLNSQIKPMEVSVSDSEMEDDEHDESSTNENVSKVKDDSLNEDINADNNEQVEDGNNIELQVKVSNTKRKIKTKLSKKKESKVTANESEDDIAEKKVKKEKKINPKVDVEKEFVKVKSSTKIGEKKKNNTPKPVSKLAVVKKLTEVLEEEESISHENKDSENVGLTLDIEIEKEEDPFFMSGDGRSNYLSVKVTKNNTNEEDKVSEDDGNHQRFNGRENKRVFDKASNKFGDKQPRFNSNKPNPRWENKQQNYKQNTKFDGKQRHEKSFERKQPYQKPDFKSFNSNRRDDSNTFKNNAKGSFEKKNDEHLHPSWEAKKKQQELIKQGFQGKKIVFDD